MIVLVIKKIEFLENITDETQISTAVRCFELRICFASISVNYKKEITAFYFLYNHCSFNISQRRFQYKIWTHETLCLRYSVVCFPFLLFIYFLMYIQVLCTVFRHILPSRLILMPQFEALNNAPAILISSLLPEEFNKALTIAK